MDKLRKDTCIWSNFYPSLLARSEIIKKPVQPSRIVVSGCSAILRQWKRMMKWESSWQLPRVRENGTVRPKTEKRKIDVADE